MSMNEIDNENATKAKATRDDVYTVHSDEHIEHNPSKPPTAGVAERMTDNYANAPKTSGQHRYLRMQKYKSSASASLD